MLATLEDPMLDPRGRGEEREVTGRRGEGGRSGGREDLLRRRLAIVCEVVITACFYGGIVVHRTCAHRLES